MSKAGHSYSDTTEGAKAKDWVLQHYEPQLGPCHSTKPHRFAAHVLDELRQRGNMYDGNTGINEGLHKAVKMACRRTSRKWS